METSYAKCRKGVSDPGIAKSWHQIRPDYACYDHTRHCVFYIRHRTKIRVNKAGDPAAQKRDTRAYEPPHSRYFGGIF